jgi:hypothetical protein
MIKLNVFFIAMFVSVSAFSAEDTININHVFVATDGRFAIQAVQKPANINLQQSCEQAEWAKYWYGFQVNDKTSHVVATILSAKARNKSIIITADGCEGPWHKLTNVYSK